jgi:hypothetical protein
MAIGSAVRSVRFENSVGQESMDIDPASVVIEQEPAVEAEAEAYDDDEDWEEDEYDDDGQTPQGEDGSIKKKVPFNRVLPVAELPDDFDGEVLDGATFLALSK